MIGDNIKVFRKNKGFTQEELAIRLNVVRQTVSKWEKGLSVPDAEALQRLADVLEVDIKQLLGTEIDLDKNNSELVEQLARINEQLVIRNRRGRRICQIVAIIFAIFIIFNMLIVLLNAAAYSSYATHTELSVEEVIVEEPTKIH